MKVIVQLSQRITLEIEEKNDLESLQKAIALTNMPSECSLCQSKDLKLTSNKDKEGNNYINLKCNNCGGSVKLGTLKAGGYFWHRDFQIYKPSSA